MRGLKCARRPQFAQVRPRLLSLFPPAGPRAVGRPRRRHRARRLTGGDKSAVILRGCPRPGVASARRAEQRCCAHGEQSVARRVARRARLRWANAAAWTLGPRAPPPSPRHPPPPSPRLANHNTPRARARAPNPAGGAPLRSPCRGVQALCAAGARAQPLPPQTAIPLQQIPSGRPLKQNFVVGRGERFGSKRGRVVAAEGRAGWGGGRRSERRRGPPHLQVRHGVRRGGPCPCRGGADGRGREGRGRKRRPSSNSAEDRACADGGARPARRGTCPAQSLRVWNWYARPQGSECRARRACGGQRGPRRRARPVPSGGRPRAGCGCQWEGDASVGGCLRAWDRLLRRGAAAALPGARRVRWRATSCAARALPLRAWTRGFVEGGCRRQLTVCAHACWFPACLRARVRVAVMCLCVLMCASCMRLPVLACRCVLACDCVPVFLARLCLRACVHGGALSVPASVSLCAFAGTPSIGGNKKYRTRPLVSKRFLASMVEPMLPTRTCVCV